MNICVTGFQGRLGSELVRMGCEPLECDITSLDEIELAILHKKPDVIINAAAFSISENMYVPINSVLGTRMITFEELWREQKKKNPPLKSENGVEIISLRGNQTKALSFYCGEGQWMPIRKVIRHWYDGDMIKLEQKWGEIIATPNHSLYSADLSLSVPQNNPELLALRSINVRQKKHTKNLTPDRLFIYAAYVTEGSTTFNKANGSYQIAISQKDREWLQKLGGAFSREFGVSYSITNKCWGAYHLSIANKSLFYLLRNECGFGSENKFFPQDIFDLSIDQMEVFWDHLLFCDGSSDGRYTTTSYKLANQISLLLSILGKKHKIYSIEHSGKKRVWQIRTDIGNHIGSSKKRLSVIPYSGWVYDLEIETSHNFVCGLGNIVCHNTNVDGCEDNELYKHALAVNTWGVGKLRDVFEGKLIHISSDYIFNGKEGSYSETFTKIDPVNGYGYSKVGAETLLLTHNNKDTVIVRTTGLYGGCSGQHDFAKLVIKNLKDGNKLEVTNSLRGNQTYVPHLAEALIHCANVSNIPNIIHIASKEIITRYEFAVMIANLFGYDPKLLIPVKNKEVPGWIAPRPVKGGLKVRLAEKLGVPIYTIMDGLKDYKDNIK